MAKKESRGVFRDDTKVLDMACGGGANLYHMSRMFPNVQFEGIDYDSDLVKMAQKTCSHSNNVIDIMQGDWFHLDSSLINKYNGIISYQTLSWIENYDKAIEALTKLNPSWIAISSLFFEGDIDYFINLVGYKDGYDDGNHLARYNVYSLPRIKHIFSKLGYTKFEYVPFNIDIDIDSSGVDKKWIGTYTKKFEDGERLQISGGIMMPWYFILARK